MSDTVHLSTIQASAVTRLYDMQAATAAYKAGGSYATYAAAVKAADIAHYKRVWTSARSNPGSLAGYEGAVTALRALGVEVPA